VLDSKSARSSLFVAGAMGKSTAASSNRALVLSGCLAAKWTADGPPEEIPRTVTIVDAEHIKHRSEQVGL
jgi:hypothetical protein